MLVNAKPAAANGWSGWQSIEAWAERVYEELEHVA